MDLVDHQQRAGERRCAQMRMLDLKRCQHDLIHRADGDGCGQITTPAFSRPSRNAPGFIGIVVPQDFEGREHLPRCFARAKIAGHGLHGFGRIFPHQPPQHIIHSLVDLACRRACRQRKIEAIDFAGFEKLCEPPECGFRLAGAGFRFENDKRIIQ